MTRNPVSRPVLSAAPVTSSPEPGHRSSFLHMRSRSSLTHRAPRAPGPSASTRGGGPGPAFTTTYKPFNSQRGRTGAHHRRRIVHYDIADYSSLSTGVVFGRPFVLLPSLIIKLTQSDGSAHATDRCHWLRFIARRLRRSRRRAESALVARAAWRRCHPPESFSALLAPGASVR
mgnify:CR=1 FL=1